MKPLLFAIGNPSRGDDALGPAFAAGVADLDLDVIEAFQLQVEDLLDLHDRPWVLFVDAAVGLDRPWRWSSPAPGPDPGVSHALSPAALLGHHARLVGPPPPARLLALRGEAFELGEPLSPAAAAGLAAALSAFRAAFGTGLATLPDELEPA